MTRARSIRPAYRPLDATVVGAREQEHRQPRARVRGAGRRRERARQRARRRRHVGDGSPACAALGVDVVLDGDRAVVARQPPARSTRRRGRPIDCRAGRHDLAIPDRGGRAVAVAPVRDRRPGAAAQTGRWARCTTRSPSLGAAVDARRDRRPPAGARVARGELRGGIGRAAGGDVSSQFLSALMLIAPLLPGGLRVRAHHPAGQPAVRRDHRRGDGRVRGRRDVQVGEREVRVGPRRPTAPRDYLVEPDAVERFLPVRRGRDLRRQRCTCRASAAARCRATSRFARPPRRDGLHGRAHGSRARPSTRDHGQPLRGIHVDMADISDLVPTVAAIARVLRRRRPRSRGVGFIRAKESNRIDDPSPSCAALGDRRHGEPRRHAHRPVDAVAGAGRRPTTTTAWRWRWRVGLRCPASRIADPGRGRRRAGPGTGRCSTRSFARCPRSHGDRGGRVRRRRHADGARLRRARSSAASPAAGGRWRCGSPRSRCALAAAGCVATATGRRRRRRAPCSPAAVRTASPPRAAPSPGWSATSWLRADTVGRLRWHLAQGHRVVLVSASLEAVPGAAGRGPGRRRRPGHPARRRCRRALHRRARRPELPRRGEGRPPARLARRPGSRRRELWAYGDSARRRRDAGDGRAPRPRADGADQRRCRRPHDPRPGARGAAEAVGQEPARVRRARARQTCSTSRPMLVRTVLMFVAFCLASARARTTGTTSSTSSPTGPPDEVATPDRQRGAPDRPRPVRRHARCSSAGIGARRSSRLAGRRGGGRATSC